MHPICHRVGIRASLREVYQATFTPEHLAGWWGNQIWLDLLSALMIGFFLAAPRARERGMILPFWFVFICCTGSVGLFAMLGRMLYLESQAAG